MEVKAPLGLLARTRRGNSSALSRKSWVWFERERGREWREREREGERQYRDRELSEVHTG